MLNKSGHLWTSSLQFMILEKLRNKFVTILLSTFATLIMSAIGL